MRRMLKRLKNIVKKLYVSDSGINVYLFSYKFDPSTLYQGVIAQELLNTPYESALHMDKNGLYSVDYSQIDVDFKKTNFV
jgi:predicted AAA+ superfamily ATPase